MLSVIWILSNAKNPKVLDFCLNKKVLGKNADSVLIKYVNKAAKKVRKANKMKRSFDTLKTYESELRDFYLCRYCQQTSIGG